MLHNFLNQLFKFLSLKLGMWFLMNSNDKSFSGTVLILDKTISYAGLKKIFRWHKTSIPSMPVPVDFSSQMTRLNLRKCFLYLLRHSVLHLDQQFLHFQRLLLDAIWQLVHLQHDQYSLRRIACKFAVSFYSFSGPKRPKLTKRSDCNLRHSDNNLGS